MAGISRSNGEALEAALDVYHGHLATQGRAWVRRVGVPVKVLGKPSVGERGRWYFRACFDGYQGADFVGHDSAGRAVVLEAKSHAGPTPWASGIDGKGCVMPSGALEYAQWMELLVAEATGCTSLIILSAWGAVWAMTPLALRIHTASVGRSTIKPDEVQHIARRLRGVEWLV